MVVDDCFGEKFEFAVDGACSGVFLRENCKWRGFRVSAESTAVRMRSYFFYLGFSRM